MKSQLITKKSQEMEGYIFNKDRMFLLRVSNEFGEFEVHNSLLSEGELRSKIRQAKLIGILDFSSDFYDEYEFHEDVLSLSELSSTQEFIIKFEITYSEESKEYEVLDTLGVTTSGHVDLSVYREIFMKLSRICKCITLGISECTYSLN